ncbi:ATP-binding protein, partial [Actinosynnema sp. NPDC023658]|uniref:ATP-binding protein n=1 Tax=Actinosynnema sp. NPDC023658 TaxID=3155465 RepID=UPI0033C6A45A
MSSGGPLPGGSASGGSFFGREAELAAVSDAVDRVPAAGLVAVAVSGEPGIGKSSLLAEACRRLRERGCAVAAAESDDVSRRIPYAAVATALRPGRVHRVAVGRPVLARRRRGGDAPLALL